MIFDRLPKLYPVKTKEDLNAVVKAAAEDTHGVFFPSHFIMKADKIVGALSINSMPTIGVWMHTTEMKPLDSCIIVAAAENMLRANGTKYVFAPVNSASPFAPVAEKHFGYTKLFETCMYGKAL